MKSLIPRLSQYYFRVQQILLEPYTINPFIISIYSNSLLKLTQEYKCKQSFLTMVSIRERTQGSTEKTGNT